MRSVLTSSSSPARQRFFVSLAGNLGRGARSVAAMASMPPPLPKIVGVCTDVEGNGRYFERFVEISKVLSRSPETGELQLAPEAAFVFNGDAVDKGSHDARFVNELVDLADRYPGRVTIILGNRDLNKMRLAQELHPEHIARVPLKDHPGVYWTKGKSEKGIADSLAVTPGITTNAMGEVENTVANRVRWILAHTMGAATTFELRRREMEECGLVPSSDDAVAQSFVDSVKANGFMTRLLKRGQLVKVIGNTLFLHGGLDESVVGWVPGDEVGEEVKNNVSDHGLNFNPVGLWEHRLNEFCRKGVESWCAELAGSANGGPPPMCWAFHGDYDFSFSSLGSGGNNLMQYGMGWLPSNERNKTVVYRDWLNKNNTDVVMPSARLADALLSSGITRVVCGHRPHGDAPLVCKSECGRLTVITLDTSYAANVVNEKGKRLSASNIDDKYDHRGDCVFELVLSLKEGGDDDASSSYSPSKRGDGRWLSSLLQSRFADIWNQAR